MRSGLDATTLSRYTSGNFDLHIRVKVANGSGTLIDLTDEVIDYALQLPNPNEPIGSLNISFVRELTKSGLADSLAPTVAASDYNKLDDDVTYSPLLQLGRKVTFEVALTGVGGSRPLPLSTLWYEIFQAYITDVAWPMIDSHKVSVKCNGIAGILQLAKSEAEYTYTAGTSLETVAQQILTNNGFSTVPINFPVATGKVLPVDYAPGLQKTIWSQLWDLAQSMGWIVYYRYDAKNPPELTFFEPARDKVVSDMTIDAYDFRGLSIDETEVRNVGYLVYFDTSGVQQMLGPFEDAASIAKYGGHRRPFWIKLEIESPIRSSTEATDMLNAALSDVADPDAVAAALTFPLVFSESGVDLYTFTSHERLFDSDQLLAPFSVTVEGRPNELPISVVNIRGIPTAGAKTWKRLVVVDPTTEPPSTEFGAPPIADIKYRINSSTWNEARYTLTALLGEGGTGPLEWRYRVDHENTGEGVFTAWSSAALPQDITIIRDSKYIQHLWFEVKDANGQIGDRGVTIPSEYAHNPKYTEQVKQPSLNLLPRSAANVVTYGDEGAIGPTSITLDEVGLKVGDVISISAEVKNNSAGDIDRRLELRIFRADNTDYFLQDGGQTAATDYTRLIYENITIPADADRIAVYVNNVGTAIGTVSARRAMLNRGPIALPYDPPAFRASRDKLDEIDDGTVYKKPTITEVAQISQPTQNLLGRAAKDTTLGDRASAGVGVSVFSIPITELGLVVGDTVTLSAIVTRTGSATGNVWMEFEGSAPVVNEGNAVSSGKSSVTAVIPAGTTNIDVRARQTGTGTTQFRSWMLNRGPVALPFEQPPFRPDREVLGDIDGDLMTGVDPSAHIAGLNARYVSRTSHGIFLETWDSQELWNVKQGDGVASWQTTDGITGATTLYVNNGHKWLEFPSNIPYDPSKLYRMRVRVRRRNPAPSDGNFYAGVAGIGADGVIYVNTTGADSYGGQHYIVALAKDQGAWGEDDWQEFTGWFSGTGPAGTGTERPDPLSPGVLHQNVRYFRPILLLSYPATATDDMEVDYVAIDVFDEVSHERTYKTIISPGVLAGDAGAYLFGGSNAETLVKKAQRIVPGAEHGEVVAWSYPNTPIAFFESVGGDEMRSLWADQEIDVGTDVLAKPTNTLIRPRAQFLNPSASQATAELLLVALGTLVAQSHAFLAPTSGIGIGGSSGTCTPPDAEVSGVATYNVDVEIYVESFGITKPNYSGTFTVVLELNTNGAGYVEVASWIGAFDIPADSEDAFTSTLSAAVSIDGGNDIFRVRLKQASTGPSGASIALSLTSSLYWDQQTGSKFASLTPDGAKFPYIVLSNG